MHMYPEKSKLLKTFDSAVSYCSVCEIWNCKDKRCDN